MSSPIFVITIITKQKRETKEIVPLSTEKLTQAIEKSKLGKAITYLVNQRTALKVYLTAPLSCDQ
ncbi:MAG: hypothetical protein ABF679_13320 [Lentilactobacillus diolivorans]|nr:MAG: hypothetical protein DUD34_06070 [Lactobacillus sp.]